MVVHLIFDVISSVVVVISCFMIKYYKYNIMDPICCFLVSIIILITTMPLFNNIKKNLKQK